MNCILTKTNKHSSSCVFQFLPLDPPLYYPSPNSWTNNNSLHFKMGNNYQKTNQTNKNNKTKQNKPPQWNLCKNAWEKKKRAMINKRQEKIHTLENLPHDPVKLAIKEFFMKSNNLMRKCSPWKVSSNKIYRGSRKKW